MHAPFMQSLSCSPFMQSLSCSPFQQHFVACNRGTLARSWSWHNTGKLTQWLPLFLERMGLKGGAGAVELPVWQTGSAARGVDDLETGEELLVIGGRNQQEVEGTPPAAHCC